MPFHIFGSLYRGGQSERFSYKEKHQDFYVFFCLGRYLQNQTHFCNERAGSGELCIYKPSPHCIAQCGSIYHATVL